MTFLEFTFQSFWHFLGVFVILVAIIDGINTISETICKKYKP